MPRLINQTDLRMAAFRLDLIGRYLRPHRKNGGDRSHRAGSRQFPQGHDSA